MLYGLRVNHHASDHGDLIVEGIRPAIERLAARHGRLGAAVRPHWRDGPHVLVGLDLPSGLDPAIAWGGLARDVATWLRSAPRGPTIDQRRHERVSQLLAVAEGIDHSHDGIRPDMTVEIGAYGLPHPLGIPELSTIRDAFKADMLDETCRLIVTRLQSPPRALLEYALLVFGLNRLAWRENLKLWPLSLSGQAKYIASVQSSRAAFDGMAEALRPHLRRRVMESGYSNAESVLSVDSRKWLGTVQRCYDALLAFVDEVGTDFFDDMRSSMSLPTTEQAALYGMTPERTRNVMSNPIQFAYRVLMNFLYEMFMTIGFSAGRRFFVCHLITSTLEEDFPEIAAESRRAGAML